ncbi:unnamed protein product, partial [Porites lobata]
MLRHRAQSSLKLGQPPAMTCEIRPVMIIATVVTVLLFQTVECGLPCADRCWETYDICTADCRSNDCIFRDCGIPFSQCNHACYRKRNLALRGLDKKSAELENDELSAFRLKPVVKCQAKILLIGVKPPTLACWSWEKREE